MEDNWFTAVPANIHDMVLTPKTMEMCVWIAPADVGLKLSFRRISMNELEEMLEADRRKAESVVATRLQESLAHLPPESLQRIQQLILRPERALSVARPEGIPEQIWKDHTSGDPVGNQVRRWVTTNCQMDDGLIPVLNFQQMAIHFHGKRIVIGDDGVAGSLAYCAAFESKKAAINIACSCPKCRQNLAN